MHMDLSIIFDLKVSIWKENAIQEACVFSYDKNCIAFLGHLFGQKKNETWKSNAPSHVYPRCILW